MKIIIKTMFILIILMQSVDAKNNDSIEKIFSFSRIGEVTPSPDAKHATFIVKRLNQLTRKWNYLLYLSHSDKKYEIIYKGTHPVVSSKWSPDGNSIAYIAPGKQFDSIWIYQLDTQKSFKTLEYKNDILSFQWSPNQRFFAFLSNDKKQSSDSGLINIENTDKNISLYVVPVSGTISNVKKLTPKNISISSGFLLPGFDWSPDSDSIVFTYQNKPGMSDPYQGKIGFVNLDSLKITTLPYSNSHAVGQVSYSPNGEWVAFESGIALISAKKELQNNPYINNQICVSNIKSFKSFCLEKTFNENSLLLGWNETSDGIFVVETYKTLGPRIYLLKMDSSAPQLISAVKGYIDLPTLTLSNNKKYIGFRYETFFDAPEAYISKATQFKLEQISHIQKPDKMSTASHELIHWRSKDNLELEGILIKPPNFSLKKKCPLYVDIHGGPADTWTNRFVNGCDEHGDLFVPTSCTANLLNLGFVIFQPNIRGSDGYGKNFRIANDSDLGGKDFEDVMSGIDFLIQKNWVDTKKIVIAGWSYGGFMSAWAITQTNRFALAIDGGGKTDMISFAGTTDMQWIQPEYIGSYFWDESQRYLNHSAVLHVKNVKTPVLILHGQNDQRVPIGQAYEFYHALKALNKPVEMLMLPNTGHAPIDPDVVESSVKDINLRLKII